MPSLIYLFISSEELALSHAPSAGCLRTRCQTPLLGSAELLRQAGTTSRAPDEKDQTPLPTLSAFIHAERQAGVASPCSLHARSCGRDAWSACSGFRASLLRSSRLLFMDNNRTEFRRRTVFWPARAAGKPYRASSASTPSWWPGDSAEEQSDEQSMPRRSALRRSRPDITLDH